jgi:hypothetical protein
MLETGGLSVIADGLGIATTFAPRLLKWFLPKNNKAKAYKKAIVDNSEAETVTRIAELEQALATKPNQANAKVLQDEINTLKSQLAETLIHLRVNWLRLALPTLLLKAICNGLLKLTKLAVGCRWMRRLSLSWKPTLNCTAPTCLS